MIIPGCYYNAHQGAVSLDNNARTLLMLMGCGGTTLEAGEAAR